MNAVYRPYVGPEITPKQARSIGLKRCPKCETWKRLDGFRKLAKRPDGWCLECRRADARRRGRQDPGRSTRYYHDVVKADPKRMRKLRAYGRKQARKRRREKRAEESERQRRYRERVYADPERHAKRKANRNAWYNERGGRESVAVSRARRAMQLRFMGTLLDILRAELDRRGGEAKAQRARKREWYTAWLAERRRAFQAGEIGYDEPVFEVNGHGGPPELARLPAGPLGQWIEAQPSSVETIAMASGIDPRGLRRYTTGESATVAIEIVDVLTTRLDIGLHDIYDPGRWPSLYEVDEEVLAGRVTQLAAGGT